MMLRLLLHDLRYWNWRRTWIGRLLGIHSPSAHMLGECWCQW